MDDQEVKNKSEGFVKSKAHEGKEIVKDQAKKQAKKKIIQFLISNPEVLLAIIIAIVVVIVLVVLIGGAVYVIDKWKTDNVNGAKQAAITYAYPDSGSSTNTSDGSLGFIDETKLVFIGDSWIEGLGQSGCAKSKYFNGIIGANADQFNGSTINIPSDASAIVLEFGLNDPSKYGATKKLAEDLHSAHPNLHIFILETSHVGKNYHYSDAYTNLNADQLNSNVDKYNAEMKKWCESVDYATYLPSVSKNITENGYLKDQYKTSDDLHLNTEGNKTWYKDIVEQIASKSGSSFLDTAKQIWTKVTDGNYSYDHPGSIPCNSGIIDCSAYVSWVIKEYGYNDFERLYTVNFVKTNWKEKYGWEEIPVSAGENVMSKLQPGDILVRDNGDNDGHMNIIVKIEGDTTYAYDCGNDNYWANKTGGQPVVNNYYDFYRNDRRSGKIIRITNSNNTSDENSNTDPDADPNANKVVIQPNKDNTAYEIAYNDDEKNLEEIRKKLEKTTAMNSKNFSNLELGILGSLMDNGANLDNYTKDELHCFPAFVKAEACTGLLDLRPNSKKFEGEEISDNYVPARLKDLKDNEVPGTVLVQRTNTNTSKDPIILEYKKPEDFNKLVDNNDINSINYFTVSEDGKLIVAEWTHTVINVSGDEYPENLSDGEKTQSKDEYDITTESFSYREITKKYTMPFELLVQLLVITEEPEFCMDLVENYVTQSKMVINIEEDETITNTVENRVYDVHSKDEKRVSYNVEVGGNKVLNDTKFLENTKDDTGKTCTNYSMETRKINIDTTVTSHSYSIEMLEIDTWIAHYKKTYPETVEKDEPTDVQEIANKAKDYKKMSDENDKSGNDKDAKEFVKGVQKDYESLVENVVPKVIVTSGSYKDSNKKTRNYKTIDVNCGVGYTTSPSKGIRYDEVLDEKGKGTGVYNLPSEFIVTTNKYNSKKATIPSIKFVFALSGNSYVLANGDAKKVEVPITNVNIKKFEKIDRYNTITTNVKKFEYDGEPTKKTHVYATKNNKHGSGHGDKKVEYEKFLVAYDNNRQARRQISSAYSWLFEMMDENEKTATQSQFIKYLLYMYDGTDYGVTELDLSIFEPDEFVKASSASGMDQLIRFIHSWEGGGEIYKNSKGVDCYKVQSDGGGGSAVGYGVDIATHGGRLKALGYDTSIGSLIPVDVVDEIEKEELDEVIDAVRKKTSGLNLTEYQIHALVSRCYNYGIAGGLERATGYFRYPSNENFVSAYNKHYTKINNDDYYGDYKKTDFNNGLFRDYMTWLNYASSGTHPLGWEYRRKAEWCLFQTGYYGYDLKYGGGHGMDEYYSEGGSASGQFCYPVPSCHTISCDFYGYANHNGIDFSNGSVFGKDIVASDGGKVETVKELNYSYGYHVIINHGNGMKTYYCHMSKIIAKEGQSVNKGDKIGEVGSTGNSTGPHCHFGLLVNGQFVDPLPYLK